MQVGQNTYLQEGLFLDIWFILITPRFPGKTRNKFIVSRSSTEFEYGALGSATCEIIWILNFLFDLGVKGLLSLYFVIMIQP